MRASAYRDIVVRIETALQAARDALAPFTPGQVGCEWKSRHNPVTEADRAVNGVLRRLLPRAGEGWLSEESEDDKSRLQCERVWVVDPLDGTREFIAGIPEWAVSIGFVHEGNAVAGGVCNPVTGEVFVGAEGLGITCNGEPAAARQRATLAGAEVLASRSEYERGRWKRFQDCGFTVRPLGSIAYKLALVAAGRADATWTLVAKHEWDVAAGVALVQAGGGFVAGIDGGALAFNHPEPRLRGLIAGGRGLRQPLHDLLCAPRSSVSGTSA